MEQNNWNKMRSLIKIHGGKRYLADFIISHFPKNYENLTYIEGCCGGCIVLLKKNLSKTEIINDLDANLINLLYFVKNQPDNFVEKIKATDYTLESFHQAINGTKEGFDGAINELIARRMSRNGYKKHFSWSERKRGGNYGEVNSWLTFRKNHLPLICERLKNVEITNNNIIDMIKEYDDEKYLFYLDPPYLKSTRTCTDCYEVEMSEEDHIVLAEVLCETASRVLISGYYSNLYAKLYKGWNMFTKDIANHSSQSKKKQRRIECLWANY